MKKTLLAVSALAAFSAFSAFAGTASATPDGKTGLAACGDIEVSAQAKCEAVVTGGCDAKCTPLSAEAKCTAELEVKGCTKATCNVEIDASCTGSCNTSCEADCTAKGGSITCQGNCEGTCQADCDGTCNAKGGDGKAQADCKASCKSSCSGRCEGSCKSTPPSADCKAKCEGSCSGSCQAKANASCEIDCRAELAAECTTRISGGCKVKCEQPEGAVVCDGQYIDQGNNAQDCINALKAQLNFQATASGDAKCANGKCEAEGEAAASCGTIAGSRAVGGEFALGAGLLGLAFGLSRSLRRKKLAVDS